MSDELVPIALRDARRFIAEHHRHNAAPRGWLFGVSLVRDGELRAVGVAGRPVARALQDGRTVEITRVCTIGDRNAASRLYGALCRAAAALGYQRAVTYTLADELGVSVRAAGFSIDGEVRGRRHEHTDGAPRALDMPQLWSTAKMPLGDKVRWSRPL